MGDRAVYCARLESVCAARHQGFESPPIRQLSRGGITVPFAKICASEPWEIRTPFDWWGASRARVTSEALKPELKPKLQQSPPIRQLSNWVALRDPSQF